MNTVRIPGVMTPALKSIKHVNNFRKTVEVLWDDTPMAVTPLLWIIENYKRWQDMLNWLVTNDIKGKKLVEFFQNESPDGGGYHCGCTHILSRMDGVKYEIKTVYANELKK